MANGLRDAFDAVVQPSLDEVVAADLDPLGYSGNGLWSPDWYADARARGYAPHALIFEANPTYSQGGAGAGAQGVAFQEARGDKVAHDGSNAIAVSDGNFADAWDCGPFAQAWAAGARRPFFPYGSVACCRSFRDAVRGHPLLIDGDWIPETWGQASLIVQTVGQQAPISTPHDFDIVLAPYWITGDDDMADYAEQLNRIEQALVGPNLPALQGSLQGQAGRTAVALGIPGNGEEIDPATLTASPLGQAITQIVHGDAAAAAVDIDAVVESVHTAWETATNANEWAAIESAIRSALA